MNDLKCPICGTTLAIRPAKGRKSNKPFVMLVCPRDGRHFRGFITDQDFVLKVIGERSQSSQPG